MSKCPSADDIYGVIYFVLFLKNIIYVLLFILSLYAISSYAIYFTKWFTLQ